MPDLIAPEQNDQDLQFMKLAYEQALLAQKMGDVPVGAVITKDNQIISTAYNKKEASLSATYHAEVLAIEEASKKLNQWRLSDCTLYVTLEPCLMCTGAIIASRISRVVFATTDPKAGAIESVFQLSNHENLNHKFIYSKDVLQKECSQLLKGFFKERRKSNTLASS